MLISHFNMDSQLILSQKLSHFECANKQHLVRGFHNPLIQLYTVRGSKIPGGYRTNLFALRADRHNGAPRVASSVGFVTKKTAKL